MGLNGSPVFEFCGTCLKDPTICFSKEKVHSLREVFSTVSRKSFWHRQMFRCSLAVVRLPSSANLFLANDVTLFLNLS